MLLSVILMLFLWMRMVLPQIDADKCTSCTKCVTECPRDIITMAGTSEQSEDKM